MVPVIEITEVLVIFQNLFMLSDFMTIFGLIFLFPLSNEKQWMEPCSNIFAIIKLRETMTLIFFILHYWFLRLVWVFMNHKWVR